MKKIKVLIGLLIIIAIVISFFILKSTKEQYNNKYNQSKQQIVMDTKEIKVLEDKLVYQPYMEINFSMQEKGEDGLYLVEYTVNNKTEQKKIDINSETITLTNFKKGKNEYEIIVKKEEEEIYHCLGNFFYVSEYNKQFLDELENNGFSTHFGDPWKPDSLEQIELLKRLGITKIRNGIRWHMVENEQGEYDFSIVDTWMDALKENDIEAIIVLGFPAEWQIGEDGKISNQEELNEFLDYVTNVVKRYPYVLQYELWNEPNGKWVTEEDMKWYAETAVEIEKILKQYNTNAKLIIGSTMTPDKDSETRRSSEVFLKGISDSGAYEVTNRYSYHLYDYNRSGFLNNRFSYIVKKHQNLVKELGGFIKYSITETGIPTSVYSEDEQMKQLVQQQVLMDQANIENKMLYTFRDPGTDDTKTEHTYGVIENNYIPKQSYFALQACYENTNGAEYIGQVELADKTQAHVYDKDGDVLIVIWATKNNIEVEIPYENFIAKDIYNNEINNDNNKLTITTSPVYLLGLGKEYFYQAISNTILEKYQTFLSDYKQILDKNKNLKIEIEKLMKEMENIKYLSSLQQQVAIENMRNHFEIGDKLIEIYQDGDLQIDAKELSSILDSVNEIGNSYEDLVTVSTIKNTINMEEIREKIEQVNIKIENTKDLNAIYPEKIYEFANDLYEKAKYVNSIQEDNPIKEGYIMGKAEHAMQLANWSEKFINCYIEEYIKENPITVQYSDNKLTNKDVIVTIELPDNAKIVNNDGKNQYIFEQNGEFTFEIDIFGTKLSQKTFVEIIDKQSPIVDGIISENEYIGTTITPDVKDDNLLSVSLYMEDQIVSDYKLGDEISEYGTYKLIAKDKAGNTTQVNFKILDPDKPHYKVDGKYIISTYQTQIIEEFKDKFSYITNKYELERDGKNLNGQDLLSTGDKLITESGEEYAIIVMGDLNKDGKVNIADVMKMKKCIVENDWKEEYIHIASDLNKDNKINITDVMKLKNKIVSQN